MKKYIRVKTEHIRHQQFLIEHQIIALFKKEFSEFETVSFSISYPQTLYLAKRSSQSSTFCDQSVNICVGYSKDGPNIRKASCGGFGLTKQEITKLKERAKKVLQIDYSDVQE
jgi:hypothetical protein